MTSDQDNPWPGGAGFRVVVLAPGLDLEAGAAGAAAGLRITDLSDRDIGAALLEPAMREADAVVFDRGRFGEAELFGLSHLKLLYFLGAESELARHVDLALAEEEGVFVVCGDGSRDDGGGEGLDPLRIVAWWLAVAEGVIGQGTGHFEGPRRVGVIGGGELAGEIARLLSGFEWDCAAYAGPGEVVPEVPALRRAAGLDEVFRGATDILVLGEPRAVPGRPLAGRRELAMMERGGVVVRLGGEGLVDEGGLRRALDEGHLSAVLVAGIGDGPATGPGILTVDPAALTRARTGLTTPARRVLDDLEGFRRGVLPAGTVNRELADALRASMPTLRISDAEVLSGNKAPVSVPPGSPGNRAEPPADAARPPAPAPAPVPVSSSRAPVLRIGVLEDD